MRLDQLRASKNMQCIIIRGNQQWTCFARASKRITNPFMAGKAEWAPAGWTTWLTDF